MMNHQKIAIVLFLSVFLTSFASAQYGSPVGNSNPGYGGTGTSVPSGDYGHKGQNPVAPPAAGGSDGNSEPEPFNFAYQVKDAPTNTDFKHEANSDGKTVTGEYSVLLPDGRNQVVTYTADENGFNAKVNYEGEAKPQPNNPAGPGSYAPASPSYPSSAPGFPSAAPSYPSSAPGFPSAAAPSYPAAAPGYPSAGGVKGSYAAPQPKNGGY